MDVIDDGAARGSVRPLQYQSRSRSNDATPRQGRGARSAARPATETECRPWHVCFDQSESSFVLAPRDKARLMCVRFRVSTCILALGTTFVHDYIFFALWLCWI